MGGPYWSRRQHRAWSAPKGALEGTESGLDAALREFREETGIDPPAPPYRDLGVQRQRSGKEVRLFAVEAEVDLGAFDPGLCTIQVRGRPVQIPELDRIAWVTVDEARSMLVSGQVPFLDALSAGT